MPATIEAVSQDSLLLRFGEQILPEVTVDIQAVRTYLNDHCAAAIIDMVPSYTTLLVHYDLLQSSEQHLRDHLQQALEQVPSKLGTSADGSPVNTVHIPVCYDPELALDWQSMEQSCQMPFEQIVQRHLQKSYLVYTIGFLPGFAFLGNVDESIATPRRASPRAMLPAGSVGIAGTQTAVYPAGSPGGWNIVGRSPMQLVDYSLATLCPFNVGGRVQFSAISIEEYHHLKEGGA